MEGVSHTHSVSSRWRTERRLWGTEAHLAVAGWATRGGDSWRAALPLTTARGRERPRPEAGPGGVPGAGLLRGRGLGGRDCRWGGASEEVPHTPGLGSCFPPAAAGASLLPPLCLHPPCPYLSFISRSPSHTPPFLLCASTFLSAFAHIFTPACACLHPLRPPPRSPPLHPHFLTLLCVPALRPSAPGS